MGWETFLSGCTESLHINERNDHREKYKATSRKKRSIKNWKKHNQRELNLAWELLTFCTIYQIYWWRLGARKKALLVPQAESKHLQLPGALSFSSTQITPE